MLKWLDMRKGDSTVLPIDQSGNHKKMPVVECTTTNMEGKVVNYIVLDLFAYYLLDDTL